jgi:F-type H+-transporting ATPase subunit b
MNEHAPLNLLKDFVFPWVNFILLVSLLVYLLRRPLKEFLLTRSKNIAQAIEHSAREKQEAETQALNYQKRLQNIEKEMQDLAESLKKEGELARRRIVEEAGVSAQRLQSTARLIGNQEYLKAKERLKEEAVGLAAEWAEKFVRENIKPQDRERLTEDYLKRLEGLS